jgi:hypothetical protein
LNVWVVGIVMQRLSTLIFIPHCVARAALAHEDRLVWECGVTRLELVPRLMREPLNVDRVAQKIVKRKHVRKRLAKKQNCT